MKDKKLENIPEEDKIIYEDVESFKFTHSNLLFLGNLKESSYFDKEELNKKINWKD